jgi:membrane-associated phospholipid phosphatase
LVYGGTLTIGLRYAFARRRPYTSINNQYEFEWFNKDGELQSFPSGHMVVAATTSTILAERIDTWWARAVLYPFALYTGFARMRNDKHWLSDIIFGAAIGYGSAKFVLNQEKDAKKRN